MITPEDREWVDERFAWLFEQFGRKAFENNFLHLEPFEGFGPDFFPKTDHDFYALLKQLCIHMDIDPDDVELIMGTKEASYNVSNIPLGTYRGFFDLNTGKKRYVITFASAFHQQPYSVTATLVHELAHVKLLGEGRMDAKSHEHEFLTDLTTVFFGFGLVSGNNYYERQELYLEGTGFSQSIGGGGYLSSQIWAYALTLYAQLKNIDLAQHEEYLDKFLWKEILENETLWDTSVAPSLDAFALEGVPKDYSGRKFLAAPQQAKLSQLDAGIKAETDYKAYYNRARFCVKHGIMEQAMPDISYLIASGKCKGEAYLLLAQMWTDLGKRRQAKTFLEKAQKLGIESAEAYFQKANIRWMGARPGQIKTLLKKAISLDSEHANSWWYLAAIRRSEGDLEGAEAAVIRALSIEKEDANMWAEKGRIMEAISRIDEAKQCYMKALEVEPHFAAAYDRLGIIFRKEDTLDKAIEYLDLAVYHSYGNEDYTWQRDLALRRAEAQEHDEWMPISPFASPDDAFNIRMRLRELGIKARFREISDGRLHVDILNEPEWLFVRESDAEAAIVLLEEYDVF